MDFPIENSQAFNLLVLGEFGVGKTAIVHRILTDGFLTDSLPTVESVVHGVRAADANCWLRDFLIFDTSGHSRFWPRISTSQYVASASTAVLVYDATRPDTLHRLDKYLIAIQLSSCRQIDLDIAVLGNKFDLCQQSNSQAGGAEVSPAEGRLWAEQRCLRHYLVSAKTGLVREFNTGESKSLQALFASFISSNDDTDQGQADATSSGQNLLDRPAGFSGCLNSLFNGLKQRLQQRCSVHPM